MNPTVPQARMAPKSVPLRLVRRSEAASATGPMAATGTAIAVHTSRIAQNPCAKNRPSGRKALASAPAMMTCRQSLARSAMRPTGRFSPNMMNTGTALITPISPELSPSPANQMPA